jgi:hypothetical protein
MKKIHAAARRRRDNAASRSQYDSDGFDEFGFREDDYDGNNDQAVSVTYETHSGGSYKTENGIRTKVPFVSKVNAILGDTATTGVLRKVTVKEEKASGSTGQKTTESQGSAYSEGATQKVSNLGRGKQGMSPMAKKLMAVITGSGGAGGGGDDDSSSSNPSEYKDKGTRGGTEAKASHIKTFHNLSDLKANRAASDYGESVSVMVDIDAMTDTLHKELVEFVTAGGEEHQTARMKTDNEWVNKTLSFTPLVKAGAPEMSTRHIGYLAVVQLKQTLEYLTEVPKDWFYNACMIGMDFRVMQVIGNGRLV